MDETLNGTDQTISNDLTENQGASQEAPKELTPEEKAEVARNRAQFRAMHDAISDLDIYEAEGVLGMVTGVVINGYQTFQEKVLLSSLELGVSEGKAQEVLDLCKDLDVQRVLTYTNALHNAINRHKYVKTKDWTVKDLDIELL